MIWQLLSANRASVVVTKPFFNALRVEYMTAREEQTFVFESEICHANRACWHLCCTIFILFTVFLFNFLTRQSLKHVFICWSPSLLLLLLLHLLIDLINVVSKAHLHWHSRAHHLWTRSQKVASKVLIVVHTKDRWTEVESLMNIHEVILVIKHSAKHVFFASWFSHHDKIIHKVSRS